MANEYTSTYTANFGDTSKRDVDETIYNSSPEETPFISSIGQKGAKARLIEWIEDELDPVGENAQVEGFEAEVKENAVPTTLENITQIFEKNVTITGTADAVDLYGRKSEYDYQKGKKVKSLKRDINYAALNGVYSDGSKTTARKMKGAFEWVDKATDAHYSFNSTPADSNHITETILLGVIHALWKEGAEVNAIFAPMTQRMKISEFTDNGRVTINQNADTGKLSMYVDLIKTNMGVHKLYSERNIAETTSDTKQYDKILVTNTDNWKRRVLRNIKFEELAKTGDNMKGQFVTELSLQCNTRKAVGSIINLTQTAKA